MITIRMKLFKQIGDASERLVRMNTMDLAPDECVELKVTAEGEVDYEELLQVKTLHIHFRYEIEVIR